MSEDIMDIMFLKKYIDELEIMIRNIKHVLNNIDKYKIQHVDEVYEYLLWLQVKLAHLEDEASLELRKLYKKLQKNKE